MIISVFDKVENIVGKGEIACTSSFSFSHNDFKRLLSQRCQKVSLCGNGLRRLPLELLCVAGIIYYTCRLVTDNQCTRYKNAFNKHFYKNICQNSFVQIYSEKFITVNNAVYFWLCINLMHITQPVTVEGYDGSHHSMYAD